MRKLLFSTAALVAVGGMLASSPAVAQVEISVGGTFDGIFHAISQEADTDRRNNVVDSDGEIWFRGSTTLDNGLTIGVNVELEAQEAGDQIDESFLTIDGAFGRIIVGEDDGAMGAMGIYPAHAGVGLAGVLYSTHSRVYTGGFPQFLGDGAFGLGFDGDNEKIVWYSPRLNGVRVGLSYTPDNDQNDHGLDSADAGQQSEVIGIGGNWSGTFDGGAVSIGGGYTTGSLEAAAAPNDTDRSEWIAGASVTMQGITLSGNYSVDDNGKSDNFDRTTIAIGAVHSMGPWRYGISYAMTEWEQGTASSNVASGVSIGTNYALGGGVSLGAEVQFWDYDDNAAGNQATVGLVGTKINF